MNDTPRPPQGLATRLTSLPAASKVHVAAMVVAIVAVIVPAFLTIGGTIAFLADDDMACGIPTT